MARSRRPPAPRAGALCCCCCCCPSRMVIPGVRRSRRCPLVTARRGLPGGPGLASARRERGRAGPGRAERSAAERGLPGRGRGAAGARRKTRVFVNPRLPGGSCPARAPPPAPPGGPGGRCGGTRSGERSGGCGNGGTPLGAPGGVCGAGRARAGSGALGGPRERGAPGRPKGEEARRSGLKCGATRGNNARLGVRVGATRYTPRLVHIKRIQKNDPLPIQ